MGKVTGNREGWSNYIALRPKEANGVITRGSAGRGLRNKFPYLTLFPSSNLLVHPTGEPNWKPEDKGSQMIPTLFTGQLSGLREGGEGWREVWRAVTMSLVHFLMLFPPLGVLPIAFPLPQCCQSFTSYSDSICFILLSKQLRCLAHINCIALCFC